MAKDFRSTPPWPYSNLTSILYLNLKFSNNTSGNYPDLKYSNYTSGIYPEPDDTLKVFQEIQRKSSTYEKLSPADCISEYSQTFLSTRRHVILVTSRTSPANGSFLSSDIYQTEVLDIILNIQTWMCNPDGRAKFANFNDSSLYRRYNCVDALPKHPTNVDDWQPFNLPIEHCLSEKVLEACSLQFSLIILLIVIACNLSKTLVMGFMAFRLTWQPLITVGDGVASFLAEPDDTTRGACLLTAKIAQRNDWTNRTYPFMWIPKHTRGFDTASRRRWFFCNVL